MLLCVLCILVLAFPAGAQPALPDVDGGEVLGLIQVLSSPLYEGRQAGSAGGRAAATLLSESLQASGYSVSSLDFPERIPWSRGAARLEVRSSSGYTELFRYREDFREVIQGGYEGGEIEGRLVDYRDLLALTGSGQRDEPDAAIPPGMVVAVPASVYQRGLEARLLAEGAAGVILELREQDVRVKPLYSGQEPGALVKPKRSGVLLGVSPQAFASLARHRGSLLWVKMSSPVHYRDVTGRTLIARPGTAAAGTQPRLYLVAHYDHVGLDSPEAGGALFPGALDNASGAALAVHVAKAVAAPLAGTSAASDFALLLTDAEEVNLSGANVFVRNSGFRVAGKTVLNLDMLASVAEMSLDVYSNGDAKSLALADEIVGMLAAAGFSSRSVHPLTGADHSPFARAGAAAVTVTEFDRSAYHTDRDTSDRISYAELDRLGDAIAAWIVKKLGQY